MNLNLNSEQFLAVYNCINTTSSLTAQEVKSKMNLILLDALSIIDDTKNQSKFDHWMKQEKEKVEGLKVELKDLKISTPSPSDDGLPFPPLQQEKR